MAVQAGLMLAGAFGGFVYEHAGLGGILGIDGLTYLVSAFCLFRLRRGYFHPRHSEAVGDSVPDVLETAPIPPIVETSLAPAVLRDLPQGMRYLNNQPQVRALCITYPTILAGLLTPH